MSLLESLRALVRSGENLQEQRASLYAEIEKIRSRPASIDPAEIEQNRVDLARAERGLADLDEAIRNAEQAKAETQAKVEIEDDNTRHAAAERQAAADARKLVPAAEAAIARAVEAITALNAGVERTAEANEKRGPRPFIVDCETRARRRPGRTIPAEFRDEVHWVDGAGCQAAVLRKDRDGEMRPIEQGFTKKILRVQTRAERVIPPQMPTRLAELLPALRAALAS